MTAAITVDLHAHDHPDDIRAACERLRERGIRATFFVPSGMLQERAHRAAALEITRNGHEAAAHSHAHDHDEIRALITGSRRDLAFLRTARAIHEDVFGAPPTAFRSPCWCRLGRATVEELAELGIVADSSATPQRLGLLSSTPFDDVWTFAPRRLHYLLPTLLEVPTSTFLVPAGWPTFLIFRSLASRALIRGLALESRLLPRRVLTLQLHSSAFNPSSTLSYREDEHLSLGAFVPRRRGGFAFKAKLRSGNAAAMAALTETILNSIRPARFVTVSQVAAENRS